MRISALKQQTPIQYIECVVFIVDWMVTFRAVCHDGGYFLLWWKRKKRKAAAGNHRSCATTAPNDEHGLCHLHLPAILLAVYSENVHILTIQLQYHLFLSAKEELVRNSERQEEHGGDYGKKQSPVYDHHVKPNLNRLQLENNNTLTYKKPIHPVDSHLKIKIRPFSIVFLGRHFTKNGKKKNPMLRWIALI